jgi:hypothetical protein
MPDTLRITKSFQDNRWVVSAQVVPDQSNLLPASIFIYENNGTETLGAYQGVCSFSELQRLQEWTGQRIPVFGNRFVRFSQAEAVLSQGGDPDRTSALMLAGAKALKAELIASGSSTQDFQV